MALLDDVTVPDSLLSCHYLDRVPQINVRENRLSQVLSRCKSSSPRTRFLSPRSSKVAPWTEFHSSTCPPSFVAHGGNPDLSSSPSSPREDISCQNTAALDALVVKESLKRSSTANKRESATHHRKSLLEMLSPRFARTAQKAAQEESSSGPHSLNIPLSQDRSETLHSNSSTTLGTTSPNSGNLESHYSWEPTPKRSSVRSSISPCEVQCPKRLTAQGYQRLGSPYSVVCNSSATTTTGGYDSCSDRTRMTFIESDETSSAKHIFHRGREQLYLDDDKVDDGNYSTRYSSLPCDPSGKSHVNSRAWNDLDGVNSVNRFSINPCFIPSVENIENVEPSSLNQHSSTKHSSIICDNVSVIDTLGNQSPIGISSSNVTRNTEALASCESQMPSGLIYARGNNVRDYASKTEAFGTDTGKGVDYDEQINSSGYHCDLQREAGLINCEGGTGLSQGEPTEQSINPSRDKSLSSTTDDSVHLSDMQRALIKIRLRRHRKHIVQQLQGLHASNNTSDAVRLPSQKCSQCRPLPTPCCPCLSLAEPKHLENLSLPVYDKALGWVSPRESTKSTQFHIPSRQGRSCKKCTHQRQFVCHCNCQRRLKKKYCDHDVCRLCKNCVEDHLICCYDLESRIGFKSLDHCCNNRNSNLNDDTRGTCKNDVNLSHTNCHIHECRDFAVKQLKSGNAVSESNDVNSCKTNDLCDRMHSCVDGEYCLICYKKFKKRCNANNSCGHPHGNPAFGASYSSHRLRPHSCLKTKPHSRELISRICPLDHLDLHSKSHVREIHSHGYCAVRSLGNVTSRTKRQDSGHHVCIHHLCPEHEGQAYKELECNCSNRVKIHPINQQGFNIRKCHRRKRIPARLRDSSEVWKRQIGDRGTLDLLNNVSNTLKTLVENTSEGRSRGCDGCAQAEGSHPDAIGGKVVLNSHQVVCDSHSHGSAEKKVKHSDETINSDNTRLRVSYFGNDKVDNNLTVVDRDLSTKLMENDSTSITEAYEKVSKRPYNSCDNTPFISKDSRTSFISSADLWYKSLVPASKARYHAQISNTIRNLLKLDPYTHDDFAFHWDPDEKKKVDVIGQTTPAQRFQERDVIKLPCGSALDAGVHHQKFILYTI